MTAPLELTLTPLHFYSKGTPFFPLIQDGDGSISSWSNAAIVRLSAKPEDDLDWSQPMESARRLTALGKWVVWEFDFGLGKRAVDLHDETTFYSYTIAIEEFLTHLWKEFSSETLGVILYRGSSCFNDWIVNLKEKFPEEKDAIRKREDLMHAPDEKGTEIPFCLELDSVELFSQYLHRLISFFPDSLPAFVLIDMSISSHAKNALLFSRRRFPHIHIAVRGSNLPISGMRWETGGPFTGWIGTEGPINPLLMLDKIPHQAVCLPYDQYWDTQFLSCLDSLLSHLIVSATPFRLICEEKLTEEWNGVDQLILFPDTLTSHGKRMVQGFCAAGGEVIDAATLLSALCKEVEKV